MGLQACPSPVRESTADFASTAAYCRRARRLRGTLARQPAKLHRKLRELGADRGGRIGTAEAGVVAGIDAGVVPGVVSGTSPSQSTARTFAKRVAAGLDGPVLRYATRRALLAEARRLRIGDFEANLIIAAVQHERRGLAECGAAAAAAREDHPWKRLGASRLGALAPVALVIAVEALLALGLWQVCWG